MTVKPKTGRRMGPAALCQHRGDPEGNYDGAEREGSLVSDSVEESNKDEKRKRVELLKWDYDRTYQYFSLLADVRFKLLAAVAVPLQPPLRPFYGLMRRR